MTAATIILAAGKQTRFRGDHLKCMSDVGGRSILAHLAEQVVRPAAIVTSEAWEDRDLDCAEKLGLGVVRIKTGTIGHSVAAGLKHLAGEGQFDDIYVVGADTLSIGFLPLPATVDMYFDPWERITIWRLSGYLQKPQLYIEHCTDRIEFAVDERLEVMLLKHTWVNVNTVEALSRARRLWREHTG
jgi:bifunctional N-acetylglucosamine-1-phosphate-uridyltransferase/glucosamine-1-phosphate-acetyltransferase GlmU-like protein